MSKDWVQDIDDLHKKYGVHNWVTNQVETDKKSMLYDFLKFRIAFLEEELNETKHAFENRDSEEIVDGLIDLCVIAIGTLDAFGVDAHKAWDEVHSANMKKVLGVKASRPNPLNLPDLTKPEGWVGPSHEDNHGLFTNALS